jgi:hypothetical protein
MGTTVKGSIVGYRCSRTVAIRDRDFWPAMFCTEGAVRRCVYLLDVGGGVAQPPCDDLIVTFSHTALPRTIVYSLIMYRSI